MYETLNSLFVVFNRSHSPYTWRMRLWQNLNGLSTVFYHSHSPYTQRTKPWQTSASVGLAQARPNNGFLLLSNIGNPCLLWCSGDDIIIALLIGSIFLLWDRGIMLHLSCLYHHLTSTFDKVESRWKLTGNTRQHTCHCYFNDGSSKEVTSLMINPHYSLVVVWHACLYVYASCCVECLPICIC